ncbi:hypothetical protein A4X09_0g3411 [Tilletia walkeri]|uniref:Uncharacterized protein n=1 Tax=Tilletia walkeri TaxID=117179 RepID=A0A8X7NBE8_9BASI|nr:hypothetical protein A4X09_0g3411 [Tilletia walkeri]
MKKVDTSGISLFASVAVCAGIGAAFILAVAVAFICKAVNRPTEEAMPYLINGRGALYQPSASGYGARQAAKGAAAAGAAAGSGKGGGAQLNRKPSHASQSRINLLGAAQPMGRDDSFNNSPSSYESNNHSHQDLSRTHTRGTSSSISQHPFPAAPMAARRPGFGPGGAHPTLPGQVIAPDGSGFTPGQIFRGPGGSTSPGASSFSGGPGGGPGGIGTPSFLNVNPNPSMDLQRPSRDNKRMSMVSMARGPPPATAESRRRSRYSRIGGPDFSAGGGGGGGASGLGSGGMGGMGGGGEGGGGGGGRGNNRLSRKIDSVGPGVLRKSMFLTADAQFPGLEALQRSGSGQGNSYAQQYGQGGGGGGGGGGQQGMFGNVAAQGNGNGHVQGRDGDPLHMRLPPLQFQRPNGGGGGPGPGPGPMMGNGNGAPPGMYRQNSSPVREGVQLDTSNFGRGF